MTDKQYEYLKAKILLRQQNEIYNYGRATNVKIPSREVANAMYKQVQSLMQAKSKITGKKNTNYMRSLVSRIFSPDAYGFQNRNEFKNTKSSKIKDLINVYKLEADMASKLVSIEPPTKRDVRYKTQRLKDFWDEVTIYRNELRRQGKSWNEIEEIIGVAYFGKEY